MNDESEHKKLLTILIGLLGVLVLLSSVATGDGKEIKQNKTVGKKIKQPEPLKNIKTWFKHEPLSVKMNSTLIIIKGAKDSCGKSFNGYKRHKTIKFKNYCPFCKKYGLLCYNPKRISEGELTCRKCDADFCLCPKGNDKSYKVRKSLLKY